MHVFVSLTSISSARPLKLPILVFLLNLVACIGIVKKSGQCGRNEPAVTLQQRCWGAGRSFQALTDRNFVTVRSEYSTTLILLRTAAGYCRG